ncbi:hypothetical protein IE53DRAFT_136710 [Violaceomyces palustris]|uniref:Uncharacterized protein n=1 Tax=Violaceomyces palustris TaxID=1673888 RepID=A0ACD0NUU8_9BASI|nr:hypothetical protein IE53DRAFT_136710 [Violaceomyces palustris]
MPSTSARQRNKRALATTGAATKISQSSYSSSKAGQQPSRLRSLLSLLLLTTILLIGLQTWRLFRGTGSLDALKQWTKAKYETTSSIAFKAADQGFTGFNKLKSASGKGENTVGSATAPVSGKTTGSEDGDEKGSLLDVQYDDDGDFDQATIQRMLDILYRPGAAEKLMKGVTLDKIEADAADDAELQDESAQ